MSVVFTQQTRQAIGNRIRITGKVVTTAVANVSITPSDLGMNYFDSVNVVFGTCSDSASRVMSVQTGAGFGIPGSTETNEEFWIDVTGY